MTTLTEFEYSAMKPFCSIKYRDNYYSVCVLPYPMKKKKTSYFVNYSLAYLSAIYSGLNAVITEFNSNALW